MNNYDIADKIELLISYAKMYLMLQDTDEWYVRNRLMETLKISQPSYPTQDVAKLIDDILHPLSLYAISEGIIDEAQIDQFETKLIDFVMPAPSVIIECFDRKCLNEGMRQATTWFYDFCCKCNYIKTEDIKKNIVWSFTGSNGDIVVTVNLSKPEKDNREVAAARALPQLQYPKCMLCTSNVGFMGRPCYPSKYNLRTIPIFLGDELWHFQFSPYSYYEQHCIALSDEHKPMTLNSASFEKMLEFVSLFPHYFIGSNAPLPIVGGSILTHEHFQGGGKVHPMFKRPVYKQYKHTDFAGVKFGLLDWYNSVIRLKSKNKEALLAAVNYIHEKWCAYSDESVGILSKTTEQHNTITPIIRMERGEIFAELILRNNRTDSDHPFGIYHPTEDLHNIKKEGIGVIEVMGTFILPGRLASEFHGIANYLNGKKPFNEKELSNPENPLFKHRFMIAELLIRNGIVTEDKASTLVTAYINKVCEQILECTAVFKKDAKGKNAFDIFMNTLGFLPSDGSSEVAPADTCKTESPAPQTEVKPVADATPAPKKRGRPPKIK
ncbi:MAG: UDP-glucose--hexose-1-phosphate uridylyltransferase [Clostridia bacterium]|nr:UDP-glucose--hexose-1-phosphate uridylyltransferase [Clostridia bacterium]